MTAITIIKCTFFQLNIFIEYYNSGETENCDLHNHFTFNYEEELIIEVNFGSLLNVLFFGAVYGLHLRYVDGMRSIR